ncbi:MAG: hypothetical protein FJ152_08310 [Firmicutes bacterium]|nr:hypothetical protein [Bacillota bacterium]
MKKAVLVLAVVLVLVGVFAVAALTQVEIERDINVSVASDIDPDVAIKFAVGTGYGDVAKLTAGDNFIEFDLSGALSLADHFNTQAVFQVGDADNEVFSITNNSNVVITVAIEPAVVGATSYLSLEGSSTVAVGETEEYYFELDTTGAMTGKPGTPIDISETLVIRKQP